MCELQPEAEATEDELLAYARENIGEHAAVPKAIHIVERTAANRCRQDLQTRADPAGNRICLSGRNRAAARRDRCHRQRRANPLHGIQADIQVTAAPQADKTVVDEDIRRTLGQFAIHYELAVV